MNCCCCIVIGAGEPPGGPCGVPWAGVASSASAGKETNERLRRSDMRVAEPRARGGRRLESRERILAGNAPQERACLVEGNVGNHRETRDDWMMLGLPPLDATPCYLASGCGCGVSSSRCPSNASADRAGRSNLNDDVLTFAALLIALLFCARNPYSATVSRVGHVNPIPGACRYILTCLLTLVLDCEHRLGMGFE